MLRSLKGVCGTGFGAAERLDGPVFREVLKDLSKGFEDIYSCPPRNSTKEAFNEGAPSFRPHAHNLFLKKINLTQSHIFFPPFPCQVFSCRMAT